MLPLTVSNAMPVLRSMWLPVVCLLAGPFASASAAPPAALESLVQQPVVLTLFDGRMPRGVLSPKTDDAWVVLSTEQPDIVIESRFAAHLVQQVAPLASESRPAPAALPLVPAPSPPSPDELPLEPLGPPPAPLREEGVPPVSLAVPPLGTWPEQFVLDDRRAVRSLQIECQVANWDADSEVDGLLVRVQPLDAWGQIVPVDGALDVQLVTETRLATGGQLMIRRDDPFRVSERWTVQLRAVDFSPTGIVAKLMFRRSHLERDLDLAPEGLVLARLRLPTAGTFDASDPNVVLRRGSRFRDDLQLYQGRRRLLLEPTAHW